jgi:hypothetical protein
VPGKSIFSIKLLFSIRLRRCNTSYITEFDSQREIMEKEAKCASVLDFPLELVELIVMHAIPTRSKSVMTRCSELAALYFFGKYQTPYTITSSSAANLAQQLDCNVINLLSHIAYVQFRNLVHALTFTHRRVPWESRKRECV